ncbi:hypothetical protein [Pseudoalteromonas piscicida]|uniref:Uncharacterized protein n=1 Tax=Pseudoalteromonas piscicida TaxID=43662 RepID=A0AAD0W353_PSEO7|nr:hypothetical protein [Pseudoalteromonas piscicida]ASD68083.1 hypothetical protein B1L02_14410 [Pseudoalteromonas piscicida]AXR01207.1 hypothetical protein D0511_03315 [Pseudoalteromonas piscicida]
MIPEGLVVAGLPRDKRIATSASRQAHRDLKSLLRIHDPRQKHNLTTEHLNTAPVAAGLSRDTASRRKSLLQIHIPAIKA